MSDETYRKIKERNIGLMNGVILGVFIGLSISLILSSLPKILEIAINPIFELLVGIGLFISFMKLFNLMTKYEFEFTSTNAFKMYLTVFVILAILILSGYFL